MGAGGNCGGRPEVSEHWGFDVPAIEKRWRIMSGMRAVFAALYAFAANGENLYNSTGIIHCAYLE